MEIAIADTAGRSARRAGCARGLLVLGTMWAEEMGRIADALGYGHIAKLTLVHRRMNVAQRRGSGALEARQRF